MAGIVPIPNTRISGLLARQRLVQQVQGDQLSLFQLQDQISTGQRIALPSDDAPAALRAIALQRLIERKDQLRSDVQTGLSFLEATDNALNEAAGQLGDIRGQAIGVAGTASTQEERDAVIAGVNELIETLVETANRRFRGRFLFAGSQTDVKPYVADGDFIRYDGNAKSIENFSDIDVLFATNAPGVDVFGGISEAVRGTTDLNPQVSEDTLLSSLHRGRGITGDGALAISDGTNTVIVDVSRASTLGDVVRYIEEHPPESRSIDASVSGNGLTLQFTDGGGGNLTVTEVAGGTTAKQLGILAPAGVGAGPLVGDDLDPAIRLTTRLDDLSGTKATARLVSNTPNSDLLLQASVNGAQFNGAAIQFVDDELLRATSGLSAGGEAAEYDVGARAATAALTLDGFGNDLIVTANTTGVDYNQVQIRVIDGGAIGDAATATFDDSGSVKTLIVEVDNGGATTVQAVIDAIAATGEFSATHDASLEGAGNLNPAATISAADIGVAGGDTGNSGGAANTLYVRIENGVSTANDVAAAINTEGTFRAQVDPADSTSVSEAGSGVVQLAATAVAAGGAGGSLDLASGIQIVNGGVTHTIDFSAAETVEDLLNTLNASDAGVLAQINAQANGIDVRSTFSGSDFQVGENGGQTATQLGIRTLTGQTKLDRLNYGVGVPSEDGVDFHLIADDGAGGTVDLAIDVSGAVTIDDVLDAINGHAANTGPIDIAASLTTNGNGVRIVDRNGRPLTVQAEFGSQAAEYLGLIPPGVPSVSDNAGTIEGVDRNYLQVDSVFTTLVRLRDALDAGDVNAMERAISQIDADINRVTFARSDIGARQQGLEFSQRSLEDEDVQLRSALSDELDVDLIEAISNLTARQMSLEASLRATANLMQLSLLNFL